MSYTLGELVSCPQLQARLDDWIETNDAGNGVIDEAMPMLQFIKENNTGLEMQIAPGNGHTRTVQLLYDAFITEDQVIENVANPICEAETERGNRYQNYEIDTSQNLAVEERIPVQKFLQQCEGNPEYFARVVQKLINALDRRVATETVEESQLLLGGWASRVDGISGANLDGDILQVPTLKTGTTTDPYPFTNQIIKRALNMSLFNQNVLIADGGLFTDYYERVLAGCCADNGIDIGEIQRRYNFAVAYDKRVQDVYGSEMGIAIQGGSLILIDYTLAGWRDGVNEIITSGSNYVQTVVVSPKTGVNYDLIVKDDCGVINITLIATTKLVGAPADMFPATSEYDNIRFVAQLEAANS